MSQSWHKRKARLGALLQITGASSQTEDEDQLLGVALDRILHGQRVIGKTAKTVEIDGLRFQDKDLVVAGTLEYGQFGVIDVVNCRLDGRVYVRKSTERAFAIRNREQCAPQFERDLLLRATMLDSPWAPHLFCAYQTQTSLNLVMDYIEGGTLWDVLESSPLEKVSEEDLLWWTPQIVCAINWCHEQGFVHRDIKPHNFVLTPDAHVKLIDFGSAAPLIGNSRKIPREYCLVPCGTCDYISPEILESHERALVALEMSLDEQSSSSTEGYGVETDWWSCGAMLYELAYGYAPFFAEDIKRTYRRIMEHSTALRFDSSLTLSPVFQDFLRRLLTHSEFRLGREGIHEILEHDVFNGINWNTIVLNSAPSTVHLPQFVYDGGPNSQDPAKFLPPEPSDTSHSQAFAFSALFQSSPMTGTPNATKLGSSTGSNTSQAFMSTSFIGFSWGPRLSPDQEVLSANVAPPVFTPLLRPRSTPSLAPPPVFYAQTDDNDTYSTPIRKGGNHFWTPLRTMTVPRTNGTVRRTVRRSLSDREAMRQLVGLVGQSAHKKVLESGRKPKILPSIGPRSRSNSTVKFVPAPIIVPPVSLSKKKKPEAWDGETETETDTETGSEAPPSPSPSPRPGSAMSMLSSRSRRSATPTMTMSGMLSTQLSLPFPSRRNSLTQSVNNATDTWSSTISLEDRTLDEMDEKFAALMYDIDRIESKITSLAGRQ